MFENGHFHIQIVDQGMSYGFRYDHGNYTTPHPPLTSLLYLEKNQTSNFKPRLKTYPFNPVSHLDQKWLFSSCSHGFQLFVPKS